MTDWIDDIRLYTKNIIIDDIHKSILLVHPHFKEGQSTFRQFLKHLKQNTYHDYTVEATGFVSLKGLLILQSIVRLLQRNRIAREVKLNGSFPSPIYSLNVHLI